ncbi:hypothetical protein QLS71_015455 [Mariniflexile litorale]|uniref:DUF4145 domain-containing protein n=1 Tax=Mariniflexile litorale TaxID=3045158 RepID=A0AAU7EC38_9FLAO|nr:hypothetical protein [Mariniflexile sp. KMM 9835]MDQ8212460.1 hypothetical protein [Mariniflexile sp. KMM 9835]
MNDQAFQILANSNRNIYANLYGFPNECPHCHKHIIPEFKSDYISKDQYALYATMICPNTECDRPFIAQYSRENTTDYDYKQIVKYSVISKKFSTEINEVSPKFIEIFNEAFFAEQNNLFEVCGVAYRKALEFLLKDYLIGLFPDKEDSIKKNTISNCISSYVEDTRLKSTSKRAIWLGNDHTHYEKKWNDKNLNDLKTLIKLTINWIESEILTKKFNDSMQ